MTAALFSLGKIVATPGALDLLGRVGVELMSLLVRHQIGDWGQVSAPDAVENELSIRQGFRILSSYSVDRARVWVLTEADRSVTTCLLPEEY